MKSRREEDLENYLKTQPICPICGKEKTHTKSCPLLPFSSYVPKVKVGEHIYLFGSYPGEYVEVVVVEVTDFNIKVYEPGIDKTYDTNYAYRRVDGKYVSVEVAVDD